MNTGWSPKPLRPTPENPLFKLTEPETVVKELSPIQRQRLADGTPHTITPVTSLRPADPALTIRPELVKGSLVEKYDERPKQPKQDPEDPSMVVKSYLAYKGGSDPDAESKQKMQEETRKSLDDLRTRIQDLVTWTGAKIDT